MTFKSADFKFLNSFIYLQCALVHIGFLFNMQNFEKGHFFIQESKKFFLFFMGDESPNAHESKSMIGLVPSAQQLTLQSSKVQNCQHWGQLLGGSPSTFLIALGEIISIFIYIFGFHWKILLILMFGLHFGLGYFCILGRNSRGRNGAQTSRSVKFFNEIQKYI